MSPLGDRWAARFATILSWAVTRMPESRRHWGRAVEAELSVVPAGGRLRWALGGLWFVLRCSIRWAPGESGRQPDATDVWGRRICALLGVVPVAPWLFVSIQGLRDDAPDLRPGSDLAMLAVQAVVIMAFLANWGRWRGGPTVLLLAIVGYGVVAGVVAGHNDGWPVAAGLIFAGQPLLAAVPLLFFSRRAGRTAA
jgi:hypothetical protein